MKKIVTLALLCLSNYLFAQKLPDPIFFVKTEKTNVQATLQEWLTDNRYLITDDENKGDYILSCDRIKKGVFGIDLIYFTLRKKDGSLVAQSKTQKLSGRTANNYLELANAELKSLIGKITKPETSEFKLSFKDSTITVIRPKKFPVTIRTNVIANNVTNAKGTIDFFLQFEYFTTDIEFKDYLSGDHKTFTKDGQFPFELNIKPDTTIKDPREYKVQLYYRLNKDDTYIKDQTFTIKIIPEAAKPEGTFNKNELILFAGTTYDHFNPGNKVSGLSIEPMISLKVSKRVWARFGVYVHPNFSRDTSTTRRAGYYKISDGPLKTDTSLIGYESNKINVGYKIQSIGFYGDLFLTPREKKNGFEKGIRISPFTHFEFVKRIISPNVSLQTSFTDTLIYNAAAFAKSGLPIAGSKLTLDKIVNPRYTLNQAIVSFGPLIEADVSNFYLYFQPMFGLRFQYVHSAESIAIPGRSLGIIRHNTLGLKFGIKYKNIISLTIDSRDFLASDEYLNISFGVPITIADLTKK